MFLEVPIRLTADTYFDYIVSRRRCCGPYLEWEWDFAYEKVWNIL
jgi:hypothetical protein